MTYQFYSVHEMICLMVLIQLTHLSEFPYWRVACGPILAKSALSTCSSSFQNPGSAPESTVIGLSYIVSRPDNVT